MTKKIPTVLVRDPDNRSKVLPEINPECSWIFNGEGVPTRKWDGTCVMLDEGGKWWARREVKPGKPAPENYILVDFDEVTGKSQGWEPIEQSSFFNFFKEALDDDPKVSYLVGTYELMGPKINGNPDRWESHQLWLHATAPVVYSINHPVLTVDAVISLVKDYCDGSGAEGVVWHHPDGRMAKLKAKDL